MPAGKRQSFASKLQKIESGVYLNELELADGNRTPQNRDGKSRGSPEVLSPGTVHECKAQSSGSGSESEEGRHSRRVSRQLSPCSVTSVASSGRLFAEPAQTLLFLDWDDTIFPCSELFYRRGLPRRSRDWTGRLPPELNVELEPWRRAVEEFLTAACALSDRCVIVTNSKPPWVTACVDFFAPKLKPFFERRDGPVIVYASEALRQAAATPPAKESAVLAWIGPWLACGSSDSCLLAWLRRLGAPAVDTPESPATVRAFSKGNDLTEAKLAAMRQEASQFYSRYPGQTWKNILSLGDMKYEHEAVKALSASRVPTQARERLRTKSVVLPTSPFLCELTLQLRVWSLLLPVCARFDGELDMDLSESPAPLQEVGLAMHLPQLARFDMPFAAGNHAVPSPKRSSEHESPPDISEACLPEELHEDEFLDDLAVALHEATLFTPGPHAGRWNKMQPTIFVPVS